ncbi:MAG: MarR family transcriptional regulator [Bacteroidetes bacterium]|nr:MarR family transcriptional regulator [Bacteroidota bacterium]
MSTKKQYPPKVQRALSLYLKLIRAHDTLYLLTGEFIRKHGLTPMQFSVMEAIAHKGPMLMGELTKTQLTTGGNITVVVNNLVELGLVKRVQSKKDQRASYVHLTSKGKKTFSKIFKPLSQYITQMASVLTEKEQEELAYLLKKLGITVAETDITLSVYR